MALLLPSWNLSPPRGSLGAHELSISLAKNFWKLHYVKMLPSQSPTFLLSFQMGHTWSRGWKQSNFFLLLLSINFLQIILVLCMLSGRHKLREDVLGVVKNIVNKMRIWDKFTHCLGIIYTIYISEVSRIEYTENHVCPVIRSFLILPW